MNVKLTPTTTVPDYTWCLKSTTQERGEVLIAVGLEWAGYEGEVELDADEVTSHVAEQIANLLVAGRALAGPDCTGKALAYALEMLTEAIDNE